MKWFGKLWIPHNRTALQPSLLMTFSQIICTVFTSLFSAAIVKTVFPLMLLGLGSSTFSSMFLRMNWQIKEWLLWTANTSGVDPKGIYNRLSLSKLLYLTSNRWIMSFLKWTFLNHGYNSIFMEFDLQNFEKKVWNA